VLSELIQRSESFQAERRKAEQEANRKRAAAAEQGMVGRAAAKAKVEALSLVPPQVEATLNAPTQKRDHATESQRGDSRNPAGTKERFFAISTPWWDVVTQ
jgi:hypothetical protein